MHMWSDEQSRYCCYKHEIGCKTKAGDVTKCDIFAAALSCDPFRLQVEYRPHYHTITKVHPVAVHVPVPIPAPPAQVITHVENIPVHDPWRTMLN